MLKTLSPENNQKYQKQIMDVGRQWADCKKITEARLQRVNEAVVQTKELETAMKETFHWMDDVDKFLEEITGTIIEGDSETIDSQVQEVEVCNVEHIDECYNVYDNLLWCFDNLLWCFDNLLWCLIFEVSIFVTDYFW